jgi:hypothetical protein
MLVLLFYCENGGSVFLRNLWLSPNYVLLTIYNTKIFIRKLFAIAEFYSWPLGFEYARKNI